MTGIQSAPGAGATESSCLGRRIWGKVRAPLAVAPASGQRSNGAWPHDLSSGGIQQPDLHPGRGRQTGTDDESRAAAFTHRRGWHQREPGPRTRVDAGYSPTGCVRGRGATHRGGVVLLPSGRIGMGHGADGPLLLASSRPGRQFDRVDPILPPLLPLESEPLPARSIRDIPFLPFPSLLR